MNVGDRVYVGHMGEGIVEATLFQETESLWWVRFDSGVTRPILKDMKVDWVSDQPQRCGVLSESPYIAICDGPGGSATVMAREPVELDEFDPDWMSKPYAVRYGDVWTYMDSLDEAQAFAMAQVSTGGHRL